MNAVKTTCLVLAVLPLLFVSTGALKYLQSTVLILPGPDCDEPKGAKCINEAMCLELEGVVNRLCHHPGYTSKAVCCTVKPEKEWKQLGENDDLNRILQFKYVNPNFPGLLIESSRHELRFKRVSKNVRQIRLDFLNFNLALPNKTTKICTEDVMIITHGSSREFKICGPYYDKHIYYTLEDNNEEFIYINITLLKKNFAREWEIIITQLMEHQKMPETCFQFFYEITGTVQMTNILLNGRDLNSGKNNRICILHNPRFSSKPRTIQFGPNLWEEIVDENTGFCQDYKQTTICYYQF